MTEPLRGQAANPIAALFERLGRLEAALVALVRRPPAPDYSEQFAALRDSLTAVEKQFSRSGREQLKANALAESQQEQARTLLEQLQLAEERRANEQNDVAARARLEVVQRMLPALDGLDEALRAGDVLLGSNAPAPSHTLFERMRAAVSAPSTSEAQLRDSLRAWLQGLTFVRQRLLDALAAEGVRPIPALGLPFDPVLHLAIQAVPSTNQPAGTVVSEIRRGYTISGRVLRHAEVAVAQ